MCRDTGLPCASFVPDCAVPSDERVPCGSSGMSAEDCEKMGCCVDVLQSTCYYPMDGKSFLGYCSCIHKGVI